MLKNISELCGKYYAHLHSAASNITKEISEGAQKGYKATKTGKCCWCKTAHVLKDLHEAGIKPHLLCGYCMEGITAVESDASHTIDPVEKSHNELVIETMLDEAEKDDTVRRSGFNNFIYEANRISARLFPEIPKF